jgi:hypothetical protein
MCPAPPGNGTYVTSGKAETTDCVSSSGLASTTTIS